MPKRILMEGLTGTYNRGGEGIIRGTYATLKHHLPDCDLIYAALEPENDRIALSDLELPIVGARQQPNIVGRAVNRALRGPLGRPLMNWDRRPRMAAEADCVVSIGGDLYTLWPSEKKTTTFQLVEHTRRMLEACPRFVLWGASIGPFEENPLAVSAFREILARMALITVREPVTLEYLAGLGITRNVRLNSDPAFLLEPSDEQDDRVRALRPSPGRRTLAVNLSPYSLQHVLGSDDAVEAVVQGQARLFSKLLENNSDLDLLLVPHVHRPGDPSRDELALVALRDHLPERFSSRVRMLPCDLRARQLKRLLSYCDVVVAARMHCAIAALSMGVPTLLLSYSTKAQGVGRSVYGEDCWVLPVTAEPDQLASAIRALFERSDDLRATLARRIPEIREDALDAGRWLRDLIAK